MGEYLTSGLRVDANHEHGAASQAAAERVRAAIKRATGGLIRGLLIETDGQAIQISGSTDLYYHKQLATRAALSAGEQQPIENRIRVCSP